MRLVTLFLIAAFAVSTVGAGWAGACCASYQKTDGMIVWPILHNLGYYTPHPYSGATLTGADMTVADLYHADVSHVEGVQLTLIGANLTGANFSWLDLVGGGDRRESGTITILKRKGSCDSKRSPSPPPSS